MAAYAYACTACTREHAQVPEALVQASPLRAHGRVSSRRLPCVLSQRANGQGNRSAATDFFNVETAEIASGAPRLADAR